MTSPDQHFVAFMQSSDFVDILNSFTALRESVGIPSSVRGLAVFAELKAKLTSWKCSSVWSLLEKRLSHQEYERGKACEGQRVLIIGAGPAGMRMALEAGMLGAEVVVLEKRDSFSRNNVLHLWPFCIEDLRAFGAKKFYGKFCAGSLDHIGIRQLQFMLLKMCLVFGVTVYPKVQFVEIIPPRSSGKNHGWAINVQPVGHESSNGFYNVVIGADGRRSCLPGFDRKEFRGKLALAITANFVNRNTSEEAAVEEISGVAFIFNQKFFKDLKAKTQIDLENIVYYKDATHYFVMTAKKACLLAKGVLLEDADTSAELLRRQNMNLDKLCEFSREAAAFSTTLPRLDFAVNKDGRPDVALFDFTSIYAAENACRVQERYGHRLMVALVGDSLLEPFWPMGTGCARAFLGCMDTAWMMKGFAAKQDPIELMIERESIFRLLPQTTPDRLLPKFKTYTIDPTSRYPNLNRKVAKRGEVQPNYWKDDMFTSDSSSTQSSGEDERRSPSPSPTPSPTPSRSETPVITNRSKRIPGVKSADCTPQEKRGKALWRRATLRVRATQSISRRARLTSQGADKCQATSPSVLLEWCQSVVSKYKNVSVEDWSLSWSNGLALCAILHHYLPRSVMFDQLKAENAEANCQLAFEVAEKTLGVAAVLTPADMHRPDKLALIAYVSQFHAAFKDREVGETGSQAKTPSRLAVANTEWTTTPSPQRSSLMATLSPVSDRKQKVLARDKPQTFEETLQATRRKLSSTESRAHSPERTTKLQSSEERAERRVTMQTSASTTPSSSTAETRPEEPKEAQKTNIPKTEVGEGAGKRTTFERSSSKAEVCFFCNKHVYLLERLSAEGVFFHRQCFRCVSCNCTLKLGTYAYHQEAPGRQGEFYCTADYRQMVVAKVKAASSPEVVRRAAEKIPTVKEEKIEKPVEKDVDKRRSGLGVLKEPDTKEKLKATQEKKPPEVRAPELVPTPKVDEKKDDSKGAPTKSLAEGVPQSRKTKAPLPPTDVEKVEKVDEHQPPVPSQPGAASAPKQHKEATEEKEPEPVCSSEQTTAANAVEKSREVHRSASKELVGKSASELTQTALPQVSRVVATELNWDSEDDSEDDMLIQYSEKRMAQQRRLLQAQELQHKMGLLEVQQHELEEESRIVEELFRRPHVDPAEEVQLLGRWCAIVNEKNLLVRYDKDLTMQFKDLELEDERQQVENDLRKRQLIPEDRKTDEDREEEQELLEQLIAVVEQRDMLVEEMESDRIKELEQDTIIAEALRKKCGISPQNGTSTPQAQPVSPGVTKARKKVALKDDKEKGRRKSFFSFF